MDQQFLDTIGLIVAASAIAALSVLTIFALVRAAKADARAKRLAGQLKAFRGRDEAGGGSDATTADFLLLRQILNAAPFPVWLRNEALELIAVNPAYLAAVDEPSEEDALKHQAELVSDSVSGSTRQTARAAQHDGEIQDRNQNVVIHGERRALNIIDVPLSGRRMGGALKGGVAGFAIDITEREDMRVEFARNLKSHAETLNKLSTPVAIYEADATLAFFNHAFAELWQLDTDWLAGRPRHGEILDAMRNKRRLPEQADYPAWKRQRLAHYTGLIEPLEELWHLPDGTTLRVVTQPHPMGGLLMFYEDVTDRLALERSYNTLIAVQRETLDNLHEAVAVFGSDGGLSLFNPTYARIWELDEAWLSSRPHISEILEKCRPLMDSGPDWEAVKSMHLGRIVEPKAVADRWQRPDGMVLDQAVVPLPDGAVLASYEDVTDSVAVEHALMERNRALEAADRLKSEFVANMSYELRTPLNSILGFAELLGKQFFGPLNEKQQDYVESILQSSESLRSLINDILDLAVIEAGGMELEGSTFQVRDILDSVSDMTESHARAQGLTLSVACAAEAGEVFADKRRIQQAIYNIVVNAINFTPKGGAITIGADGGDEEIRMWVKDTGIGISEEDRASAFDAFRRGSGAGAGKGVGLGLALVRRFVDLHGGRVELDSEPGQGTLVTCVLPRRQRIEKKVAAQEPAAADLTA
ncbi:MAG: PAS-domain containing protein [Sphingomonadales bacterium]|nr:PAS-domain containing protein [Sphingomonadales bacterium]